MATKTKVVMAGVAGSGLALAAISWLGRDPPVRTADVPAQVQQTGARPGDEPSLAASAPVDGPAREAAGALAGPAAETGTLNVHVRYASEPSVAAGIAIDAAASRGVSR